MAYAYQADIYCDACGDAIKTTLNQARNDTGDSEEYPQHGSNDEPTDSPQHCGAGEDCLEAITLPYGGKIGCLIGTSLTAEGIVYVREAVQATWARVVKYGERAEPHSIQVCKLWEEEFSYVDFHLYGEDEDADV